MAATRDNGKVYDKLYLKKKATDYYFKTCRVNIKIFHATLNG